MKNRNLKIVLGVAFALMAFGAFNTQTAEAGHRHHRYRRAYVPRYCAPRYYAPRYYAPRYVVPAYPRYGISINYGYQPSYGYGYGYGYGGGFCY